MTITDNHGASDTQPVTITILGTNDEPVVIAEGSQLAGDVTEDAADQLATGGRMAFADVDLSDTHTASAAFKGSDHGHGELGSLTAEIVDDSTGTGTGGRLDWSYTISNAAVQFLTAGQQVHQTYTVTIDDLHGGTASREITITLTGENDPPVIVPEQTTATTSISEDAGVTGSTKAHLATGTVAFGDVDLTDTHGFTVEEQGQHYLGKLILTTVADSTGTGLGSVG